MYKIAITGKANSGKNTLSRMLVRELRTVQNKYVYPKYMAFADPIKEMVSSMYPTLPKKFLYGSSKYRAEVIPGAFKNESPLTVRQLLIDLGTDVGRTYCPTIWLDNFDYRFDKVQRHSYGIVVVTDVRFRNEFDHLATKGFYQIRLYRDTGEYAQSNVDGHVSETNQDTIKDQEFDYVLFNNKTIKDLKLEVRNNIIPQMISR